jgi:hypothetical protein
MNSTPLVPTKAGTQLASSPEERTALVALAEGVPGVIGVSDEMIPSYS